jgi:7,8-dihydropterin-6-yl-methyl-4-(beta-D-ribofuranosyl)aminobenzene 5'-phosphate synthase
LELNKMKRAIEEVQFTLLADGKVELREYLGEAGLSVLVDVTYDDSSKFCFLFDTASSTPALRHNIRVAEIDPTSIEMIILSHGHWDHVGGMMDVLAMTGKRTPIICHPQALAQKIYRDKEGKEHQIGIHDYYSLPELERKTDIIRTIEPYVVGDGIVTTGEVPRISDFENLTGRLCKIETIKEGKKIADTIEDDMSLIFQLKDNSVVILAGCCHSGIVNTAMHAGHLTGSNSIIGIIGGLHLNDASKDRLSKTVERLTKYPLTTLAPCHCTGLRGQSALMNSFESIFKIIGAGSVIKFTSS